VNKVELAGGLPRDPELRFIPSGVAICEFSIAVREAYWSGKDREEKVRTSYIGCFAWAELAEYIAEKFHRADEVYLIGQLTQEEYEKDGKKHSKTKVRVLTINPVRRASGRPQPQPGEGVPDF
jgi:single-strand DNA-binding protein